MKEDQKPFSLKLVFAVVGRNNENYEFTDVSAFEVGELSGRSVWTVTENSGKQSVFLETNGFQLIRYSKK